MQEVEVASRNTRQILSRKAWFAYVSPAVVGVAGLAAALYWRTSIAGLIGLIALSIAVYNFLFLKSVYLYVNDAGVWVYRGILPWNKGSSGVKWRDLSEALYYTGFMSWACRSWNIRIGHRFTKSSEIFLDNMTGGPEVVQLINGLHQKLIGQTD